MQLMKLHLVPKKKKKIDVTLRRLVLGLKPVTLTHLMGQLCRIIPNSYNVKVKENRQLHDARFEQSFPLQSNWEYEERSGSLLTVLNILAAHERLEKRDSWRER